MSLSVQSSYAVNTPTITEFKVRLSNNEPNNGPYFITSGPDGNLWFTKFYTNKIGRITPKGKITEFEIPGNPFDIGYGSLWITASSENGNKIVRFTPNAEITEFSMPSGSGANKITLGNDGNFWFTEYGANKIGRMTPSGEITEFTIPTNDSGPQDITTDADGNLWFTEYYANKIGKITTSGEITEFLRRNFNHRRW